MEIICVNSNFLPESKRLIPTRPVEGNIYNIRDVINYPDGRVGFLLEEIFNPEIPHPSGIGTFEPTFNKDRFTKLDQSEFTKKDYRVAIEEAALNLEYQLSEENWH